MEQNVTIKNKRTQSIETRTEYQSNVYRTRFNRFVCMNFHVNSTFFCLMSKTFPYTLLHKSPKTDGRIKRPQ